MVGAVGLFSRSPSEHSFNFRPRFRSNNTDTKMMKDRRNRPPFAGFRCVVTVFFFVGLYAEAASQRSKRGAPSQFELVAEALKQESAINRHGAGQAAITMRRRYHTPYRKYQRHFNIEVSTGMVGECCRTSKRLNQSTAKLVADSFTLFCSQEGSEWVYCRTKEVKTAASQRSRIRK